MNIPSQFNDLNFRFTKVLTRSKQPIEKNWQNSGLTIAEVSSWNGNVGVLLGCGKLVAIDADDKPIENKIARELPTTFTVKTGKGCHFYFLVDAIDDSERAYYSFDDVNGRHLGELRIKKCQCLIPPSIHPSGAPYTIQNDVPIATVTLASLKEVFKEFINEKKARWAESIRPVNFSKRIEDIVDISCFRELGEELQGAHPVHSSTTGNNFCINTEKQVWHCFRHGCGGDILGYIAMKEGLIQCGEKLAGQAYTSTVFLAEKKYGLDLAKKRKRIFLPTAGKLNSVFVREIADVIKDTRTIYFRPETRTVVEIGWVKYRKDAQEVFTGFVEMKPSRFVTLAEQYFTPMTKTKSGVLEKSMTTELANIILSSAIMQNKLPSICRIFPVQIPVIYDGKLTFPEPGYDERFNSWLPNNAPRIKFSDMPLTEAKEIIATVFVEFCFRSGKNGQDFTNAVAGLITPFIRGVFSKFNVRTPVFFYLGNRERCGKDYCAGVTGLVYEGTAVQEAPVSTSENNRSNNTEELRKKLLSAMIGGRKRLHFSNNKGFLNNATFEAVTTAESWRDRVLGRSEELTFDNEIDFSLSGNTGIGFTPDFANRCRFVRLFFDKEDANARVFKRPDLHGWVLQNRELILSALYALVRNWFEKGCPAGTKPFASFPEWARVCGGIMEAAGYGSPCEPDADAIHTSGDSETQDMKALFELCYERHPEDWITKKEIKEILQEEDCLLFSYLDFDKKPDQTKFGNKIQKFIGRVFSDIRMVVKDSSVRASRQEYKFTKKEDGIGNPGNLGNLSHTASEKESGSGNLKRFVANVTNVTKTPVFGESENNGQQDILAKTILRLVDEYYSKVSDLMTLDILLQAFAESDHPIVLKILDDLKRKSVLFEPRPGTIKRI